MLALVATCLLAALPAAQEPANAGPVTRELRLYPLSQAPLSQAVSEDFRVRNRWFENAPGPAQDAVTTEGRDTDTRVRLNFTFEGGSAPNPAPELADLATLYCEPPIDPARERIQVAEDRPGVLLAYLQPAQHAWLTQFLALQAAGQRQWAGGLHGEVIALPRGAYHKLGLPAAGQVLEDEDSIRRMREALMAAGGVVQAAPRMKTRPRQIGELSLVTPVYYVSGYEVRVVEPGAVEVVDPVIDFVPEGYVLKARVLQVSETRYGVTIDAHSTRVIRPIPVQRVPVATAVPTQREIARPARRHSYHSMTARLADGGGVLIAASGTDLEEDLVLLLTLRRELPPASSSQEEGNF